MRFGLSVECSVSDVECFVLSVQGSDVHLDPLLGIARLKTAFANARALLSHFK